MEKNSVDRLNELIDDFSKALREEAFKLAACPAVEPSDYDLDGYAFQKVILTAAIERVKGIYAPASWRKNYVKDVKNLIEY